MVPTVSDHTRSVPVDVLPYLGKARFAAVVDDPLGSDRRQRA